MEPNKCCGSADCISLSDKGKHFLLLWKDLTSNSPEDRFTRWTIFISVQKLLDKDVLEIQLASRYSKKEVNCEPNPSNFRWKEYFLPVFAILLWYIWSVYIISHLFHHIELNFTDFRPTETFSSQCMDPLGLARCPGSLCPVAVVNLVTFIFILPGICCFYIVHMQSWTRASFLKCCAWENSTQTQRGGTLIIKFESSHRQATRAHLQRKLLANKLTFCKCMSTWFFLLNCPNCFQIHIWLTL